jgi:hypothetical protein
MTWFQRMYSGSWLRTSRRQSYTAPSRWIDDFSSSIRASVNGRGWVPVLMAAFSAGSPKLSKPMGDSTAWPCMVRYRTMRSPKV